MRNPFRDTGRLPTLFIATALAMLLACAPRPQEPQRDDLLADLGARFQAELDRIHAEAGSTDAALPGATAAFILPDGRVFGCATGYSDVELGIPMTPDMRMPSGSIGKTYVAAVVLSLAHDGVLSLDDPISTWLGDEGWFGRLPNGDAITVRMLLNHSGGLINHVFDLPEFQEAARTTFSGGDPDRYLTPRELVEFILDREPLFEAGEGFHYTDTGYILVGMIVEEATGSSYYEELARRFLEPLDLRSTLPQDRRRVPDLAQGYSVQGAELLGVPPKVVSDGELAFNPLTEWTGGGLYNNPQDLVRWAKALYEGDAMPGDYLEDLLGSVAPTDPDRPERVYGLGVGIYETPYGMAYGHGGFFPGYLSLMRYFPDHRIAVAMQMNSDAEQPPTRMDPLIQVVVEGLQTTER
jgi:D-alanyl-D-alanine carboxypeptidase